MKQASEVVGIVIFLLAFAAVAGAQHDLEDDPLADWPGREIASTFAVLIINETLCSIDLSNIAVTPIGGQSLAVIGIAFDVNGVLYGIDPETDSVLRIDHTTGESVVVAPLDLDILSHGDITFDAAGRLWMVAFEASQKESGFLFEVDPKSGETRRAAAMPASHRPDLSSLGVAALGGEVFLMNRNDLYRFDPTTGAIDLVVELDDFDLPRFLTVDSRHRLWATGCACSFNIPMYGLSAIDHITGELKTLAGHDWRRLNGFAISPVIFADGFESEHVRWSAVYRGEPGSGGRRRQGGARVRGQP